MALSPSPSRRSWLPWLGAAAIAAGAFVAMGPAIGGEYLWDDHEELDANPDLRTASGLFRIWFARPHMDYLPLKTSVQWLEWHLWGGSSTGYHLVSLGLHAASALLLWRVLARCGLPWAWLGGMIFAVHPLAVDSVAWMAELKNTVSLPFLLLAFLEYGASQDAARPAGPFLGSLAFYVLSLLGKASGILFPGILLLHAWWTKGRIGREDVRRVLPFLAVSVVFGLATLWLQVRHAIAGVPLPLGGGALRTARAGALLIFYFSKAAFPWGLQPLYAGWPLSARHPAVWLPGLAAVAAAVWLASRSAPWRRGALFGLGCFALALAPVLGFAPMYLMRFAWAMDHLAYLALAAAAGLAAAALGALARAGVGRRAAPLAAAALIVALAAGSRAYAGRFRRSLDLWAYAPSARPDSWIAEYNDGVALHRAGLIFRAMDRYERSLQLYPQYSSTHLNYGNLLRASGRREEAERQYRLALRLRPNDPEVENNLCCVLQDLGRPQEAISHGERAVRLRPSYAEACNSLGNALDAAGRAPEAARQFQEALRLNPNYAEAENGLGAALVRIGRLDAAADAFRAAVRLNPDDAMFRANLEQVLRALDQHGR